MIEDYFAATYSDARGKFLAGCLQAGAAVVSYRNPARGPQGEALFTDVARLGRADAPSVLIVESATHGAEGFCGSGIQVGLLCDTNAPRPGDGVALLLMHAINPYGFAWLRRVNEGNVDLNRSFVDHEAGDYPQNALYDEIADALVPETWDEGSIARGQEILDACAERHGAQALDQAVRSGQYRHPECTFYGGRAPTWSNKLVGRICAEHLAHATRAALIDIHSGLGPYGYGEPLTVAAPGTPADTRARAWYGDDVRSTMANDTAYAGAKGSIIAGYTGAAPHLDWTCIGLEFGTRPVEGVRLALRADAWLHRYGDPDSEQGRAIKRELRDASYPDELEWKTMVWERGRELVAIALERLAAA